MQDSGAVETPTVFISYSLDSEEHQDRVLRLSDRLRIDGVSTVLDQYVSPPPQNWPEWMDEQLEQCKFVLMVLTEQYCRKAKAKNPSGVRWESVLIQNQQYARPTPYGRFIPVFFDTPTPELIPTALIGSSWYVLDEKYDSLYAHLTSQPRADPPPVGRVRSIRSVPASARRVNFIRPWYVPLERNPLFHPDDVTLAAIDRSLSTPVPTAIADRGLAPTASRAIALEYVYDRRDKYSAVFWLPAASADELRRSAAEIARMLNLPESLDHGASMHRGFVGWLEHNPGWLIVFDQISDPGVLAELESTPRQGRHPLRLRCYRRRRPGHDRNGLRVGADGPSFPVKRGARDQPGKPAPPGPPDLLQLSPVGGLPGCRAARDRPFPARLGNGSRDILGTARGGFPTIADAGVGRQLAGGGDGVPRHSHILLGKPRNRRRKRPPAGAAGHPSARRRPGPGRRRPFTSLSRSSLLHRGSADRKFPRGRRRSDRGGGGAGSGTTPSHAEGHRGCGPGLRRDAPSRVER